MEYSTPTKPTTIVQSVWTKWLSFVLCLFSLAVSAVLFSINFAGIYWFPISGIHHRNYDFIKSSGNDIAGYLQLAAKAYEILVVACLGAMTLDVYKRHLVEEGVPFGLLTSAYRVSDIKLILNPRFWTTAQRSVWLAVMLLLSVLLGTLLGPASAILIVPKLGLFPIPHAFSNIDMPLLMTSFVNETWPTTLSNQTLDLGTACQDIQGAFQPECPAGGFSNIYGWVSGWGFSGLPNNITFPDPSGSVSRRLDMWLNGTRGTFLTSPSAITVSALGQFKSYTHSGRIGEISHTESYKLSLLSSSKSYQPLVNAKCNVWSGRDYESILDIPIMAFPYKELNCFSNDDCIKMRSQIKGWHVPEDIWNGTNIAGTFDVIDKSGEENAPRYNVSSLLFFARLPYYFENVQYKRVVACSYMAHWLPSTFWANSTDTEQIATNVSDLSIFSDEKAWEQNRQKATVGSVINIDGSWLPYLSLGPVTKNDTSGIQSVARANFENLGFLLEPLKDHKYPGDEFSPGSSAKNTATGDREVQKVMEKLTGTIVTDAIARTRGGDVPCVSRHNKDGSISVLSLRWRDDDSKAEIVIYPNGTYRDTDGKWSQHPGTPQRFLEILKTDLATVNFKAERYGYGYGLAEGSIMFAYVVIGIYAITVLVYWAITLLRRARTVAALGDLQDVVALAWKSRPPPELEGHGVDVMDKLMWQDRVMVRATSTRVVTMALDKERQEKELAPLAKGEGYW